MPPLVHPTIGSTVYVPRRLLSEAGTGAILADMVAKYHNQESGETRDIALYRKSPNGLYLPRAWVRDNLPSVWAAAIDRTSAPSVKSGVWPIDNIPARDPKQEQFMDGVSDLVKRALRGEIIDTQIEAGTGTGKTVAMLNAACDNDIANTLIIVHRNNLKEQWLGNVNLRKGLRYFFGEEWVAQNVGVVQQDVCQWDRPVVIAMAPTLCSRGYPKEFYDRFGVIFIDECFTDDTDVLTSSGWVSIANVTTDDKVAQFNTSDSSISFVYPSRTVRNRSRGSLVHVEGTKFSLLTTPNHEQPTYYRSKNGNMSPQRYTVGKLPLGGRAYIPVSGNADGDDLLTPIDMLRVAFQADGHLLHTANDGVYTYRFAFRKQRKVVRLTQILNDCKIPYSNSCNARGDTVITARTTIHLSKYFSWVGYEHSGVWYAAFLKELTLWDGWSDHFGGYYETPFTYNAELVQTVAHLCGHVATQTTPNNRYRIRWAARYYVSAKGQKSNVAYSGDVYCVTVPTGNILVRRNGKIFVSGNCHKFATPVLHQVLKMFPARAKIGATATIKTGTMSKVTNYHLGKPSIVSHQKPLQPKVIRLKNKQFVEFWKWNGPPSPVANVKACDDQRFLQAVLPSLADRNELLARVIYERGYQKGRYGVVLGDRVKHVVEMRNRVIELGADPADCGLYVGEYETGKYKLTGKVFHFDGGLDEIVEATHFRGLAAFDTRAKAEGYAERARKALAKKYDLPVASIAHDYHVKRERYKPTEADRVRMENNCRFLFVTFHIFDTAIDISRLDWGLEISIRGEVTQAVGRVLRIHENKPVPVWYTVEDDFIQNVNILNNVMQYRYSTPKRLAESRIQSYNKQNAEISIIGNPRNALAKA